MRKETIDRAKEDRATSRECKKLLREKRKSLIQPFLKGAKGSPKHNHMGHI